MIIYNDSNIHPNFYQADVFLCFVVFQAVLLFTNKLREHKLTFSYAIFAITSFGTKAYQAER